MLRSNRICSPAAIAALIDHGLLLGLGDDDHTQYLLANGTRALAGAWNMGSQNLTNVDINSGTLASITIDGNWTAAGQTCADLGSVTTCDINAGTVDAITSLTVANNVDIGNYTLTANGLTIDGAFTDGTLTITGGDLTTAGTGTFGDLVVDTDTLVVDAANNRVGIGTSSPDSAFHIKANIPGTVGSHPAGQLIIQDPDDTVFGNVVITAYESDGAGNPDQQLWYLGSSSVSNTDIIFLNRRNANLHLGTNGVSRLTILGNGNVGINEQSPQDKLEVNGTVLVKDKLKFTQDDGNEYIDSLNDGYMDYGATTGHRFNANVDIAANATLQGLTINHPTLSQINLKEGASAKWRLGYDANSNILFWRDEANGNTVFSMEDAAPASSIYIKSDGTIGFGTSLSTAHLTILTPAGAGETARESILKANVSDAGNDTFGIGNGTSTVNVFAPIFYGLVTSNSAHVPLTFRGFVLPANDASDSSATGLVSFQAFRTDSATDPANGAFSNAVNRKLFTWGTQSDQTLIVIPANKNVGIGVADPHSKLEVNGAISSNTRTFSTAGPTDDVDVANINTLFVDSASNNVTIGGFANGVDGQVLYITRISAANNVTVEHNEGGATQPILLHKGTDETLSVEFGGWMFVCHGGIDWHDLSHAKHVV